MKHNKITFGVLAFIITCVLLINVGALVTKNLQFFPDHEISMFVMLLGYMFFPLSMAWNSALYFVKYLLEIKKNHKKMSHVINIVRATLGITMLVLSYVGILPVAHPIALAISGVIFALFVAELVIFFKGLKKPKKVR